MFLFLFLSLFSSLAPQVDEKQSTGSPEVMSASATKMRSVSRRSDDVSSVGSDSIASINQIPDDRTVERVECKLVAIVMHYMDSQTN